MNENPTEYGLKQYKKFGKEDWHIYGIKSGDIVKFEPIQIVFYWQNKGPLVNKTKLTIGKEYIVEYAYSTVIQIKCDTGRIVSYNHGNFQIKKNNEFYKFKLSGELIKIK
jgi:hypothetical protein